ncbi:CoA transferase [Bradyrhizobium sp. SSUT112]|uniref:CoA transferase n=1 Tax=Bradyrhizobium sp. SSUT112 TaxID=3040604 RepID=UPI0024468E14|nr:CoA transferase [Bradyrhizobium sp. SSUT112]MDH2357519.1 CoA transferase [Bradyrhizobium sp. SSUT112]
MCDDPSNFERSRLCAAASDDFSDEPYGIYGTRDGHIAISLGSLDALSEALGVPADQRIPDHEAYRRRDEASAAIAANVGKRTTAECIGLFEARGISAEAWPWNGTTGTSTV